MEHLQRTFKTRDELVLYVQNLAPWAQGGASDIVGGSAAAYTKLKEIDPYQYALTRNYSNGKISYLSPYIQHGILGFNQVRDFALSLFADPPSNLKFIQELAWRDFWQRVLLLHPEWAWNDAEPYKTGFNSADYSDELPVDIINGTTGLACIDAFIHELLDQGYIHNHARMYVASYIVHFRQIKWQVGARWFLQHLLDGNIASNNLSWQWVASTFSHKPYIFNLENVDKYFRGNVDTSPQNNKALDADYKTLNQRLFPNLKAPL